jgi:O-antigen ligase
VDGTEPTAASRLALRVLQLGAIAVVVAVSTRHIFDLDRFLVPKELALHATALLGALFGWRAIRRIALTRIDWLLLGYLLLGAMSALLATNRWLGVRAFAVSASAVMILWLARGLSEAGLGRRVLNGLALAVVLAAVTSLLQAYGVYTHLFALNRAPGGTLGNRNFVAHAAAFGLPLVILAAMRAKRFMLASCGVAIVFAALVLTRSRAAWLASAAMLLIFFVAILASAPLRRDGRTWRRIFAIVLFATAGVAAALLIPNALHWTSDNPYLESVKGVADYEKGSGHGRLIQYRNSLFMALRHPLFGVGPGNWPVEYPRHVKRGDRSLDPSDPGMTFNPWPSSDWMAFLAERGIAATVLFALALLGIFVAALRRLRTAVDAEQGLLAATLLATLAATGVAGMFDAVLLLALPSLIIFAAIGALWPVPFLALVERQAPSPVVVILIIIAALATYRSTAQLIAMEIFATQSDRASIERAARIDPANYSVQMRLARRGTRKQRCEHALAARSLYPLAEAARDVSRGCAPPAR